MSMDSHWYMVEVMETLCLSFPSPLAPSLFSSLPLLSLSFHPSFPPLLSPSLTCSYLPLLLTTAISPHSLTTVAGVIAVFQRTHTAHLIVDLTHHTDGPHVSSSLTTKHRVSLASGGVIEMDGPVANIQTYLSLDNYLNVT